MTYRYSTPLPLLQKLITRKHFIELCAEEQLSPRGEERDDLRSAMICATVARGAGAKNVKLEDYQLKFDVQEKKEQTQEEFDQNIAIFNAQLKRAGKYK